MFAKVPSAWLALVTFIWLSPRYASAADSAVCPRSCPATYLGIVLTVSKGDRGATLEGAKATLTGPTTVAMSCAPNGSVTSCSWPPGQVIAGTYSLLVTAPGFRSRSLSATVSVTADSYCGCTVAALQPSAVTLVPSP